MAESEDEIFSSQKRKYFWENATFTTYICSFTGADDDETSKKFLEVLNDEEISSKLHKPNAVCIKVQNGTQSCSQFSQIYPVVLLPSIYFIDSQSGVNIEIYAVYRYRK